jgi:hypothetical protein
MVPVTLALGLFCVADKYWVNFNFRAFVNKEHYLFNIYIFVVYSINSGGSSFI